ncbi:MAG: RidA family protein [Terriglobia bacterium]|jgi:2-iminobutanoate/2-iminopropanoate deaminase
MNKLLLKLAVLLMAHLAAASLMAAGNPASSSAKRAINPPGTAEGLPFSNGILVGNTLYVAGQEGSVNGKLADGIGPQTEAALGNIKKIVEQAGFQMSDVVSVTVYMADLSEFGDMNKVYKTFFPEPRPARATVQVAALVSNARIEISAIAVKTK